MAIRPRFPTAYAISQISLRGASLIINIIFLAFVARLQDVWGLSVPAAYFAACWAILLDALEVITLSKKNDSIPRLSAGSLLTLDILGFLLLAPAAIVNWFANGYSNRVTAEDYYSSDPSTYVVRDLDALWLGCAALIMRFILVVFICVDCCRVRRARAD